MDSNERPLVPPSFFPRARSRAVFPRTAMGFGILGLLLMFSLAAAGQPGNDTIVKNRPYMGWSTWSLQAHFGSSEPTGDAFENEVNIKANSDAMRRTGLQAHGFEYINVDGDWDYGLMCQCGDPMGWDAYGRPVGDPQRFPSGMAALAAHIHGNGQKAGIYWEGGIPPQVYAANTPILGTPYHVQDIALKPLTTEFNSFYVIDFTKTGAQEYIDSIIQEFAEWGYDYLKVDGVKNIDRDNVAAISKAIRKAGRPMYLNLSSNLNHDLAGWWERYTSGRRIDGDVECSRNTCTTALARWWNPAAGPAAGTASAPAGIFARFTDPLVSGWVDDYGNWLGWNDYDTLEVGNGSITSYPSSSKEILVTSQAALQPSPDTMGGHIAYTDGLANHDERQSAVTMWAIGGSTLQLGADLTLLDSEGIDLLTNDEVIAVDQSGRHGDPVYEATYTYSSEPRGSTVITTATVNAGTVWEQTLCDGTYYVALFNLDLGQTGQPVTVSVNWADLGFSGPAEARDLWQHSDLGVMATGYSVSLNSHGSSLIHVKPVGADAPPWLVPAVPGCPSTRF